MILVIVYFLLDTLIIYIYIYIYICVCICMHVSVYECVCLYNTHYKCVHVLQFTQIKSIIITCTVMHEYSSLAVTVD